VWVLAHVAGSKTEIVPGDRVDSFILLSNSHDGTLAVRVGFTPIRVVCANTLSMAHSNAGSKLLRVRHTKSVNDTLALIRDVMDLAEKEFAATAAQYRALAARHVNATDLRKYVRQVLQAGDKPEEDSGRMRNLIADIIHRAEYGTGNDATGVRGTLWAAYNGVTEHLTHARGSDRDARLNSLWFGSSADVSKRALELALAMAS
jgi:phage/plasmid-like protein (TIGR03299 family)